MKLWDYPNSELSEIVPKFFCRRLCNRFDIAGPDLYKLALMFSASYISAFSCPACYAVSNILDTQFGSLFKNRITFIVAQSRAVMLLLLLPAAFIIHPALNFSLTTWAVVLVVAAIEYLYVYPYFWALKHTDTSIVVSLFSLGKIVIPVLAWFFLGEVLHFQQYVGFFIIIFSSLLMTMNGGVFQLNKAILLMLLASVMLSVSNLLSKAVFLEGVDWFSYTFLAVAVEGAVGTLILLIKPRTTWVLMRCAKPTVRVMFGLEAIASGLGNVGYMWALSLLPLTIVKGVSATQPLFVLVYATAFGTRFPKIFNEAQSGIPTVRKIIALCLMVVGAYLTV